MIKTQLTLLRPPISEDKTMLLEMRNDIEGQLMLMSRSRPSTIAKLDNWLNARISDENAIFFVVADADTNNLVGYVQLINLDFINRRGELGICILKKYHGNGYANDAIRLLEGYSKRIFGIHKITLQVLTNNARAIKFYEKSGYNSIGTMTQHFYFESMFHDIIIMEKLL